MADTKISDLTALLASALASGDLVPVVDVSDTTMAASGTNKKVAWSGIAALFDAAGLAAAAQAASQPLDSDLTAIAALSTTSYGRAFLALANLAALQAVLGTGTPSSSTYLRGDGTWSTPAGGSSDPLDGNNIIITRVFAR